MLASEASWLIQKLGCLHFAAAVEAWMTVHLVLKEN